MECKLSGGSKEVERRHKYSFTAGVQLPRETIESCARQITHGDQRPPLPARCLVFVPLVKLPADGEHTRNIAQICTLPVSIYAWRQGTSGICELSASLVGRVSSLWGEDIIYGGLVQHSGCTVGYNPWKPLHSDNSVSYYLVTRRC